MGGIWLIADVGDWQLQAGRQRPSTPILCAQARGRPRERTRNGGPTGPRFSVDCKSGGSKCAVALSSGRRQRRQLRDQPRSEPFELELEELFDDEFEFELLEELELEFEDEFEFELLDELELEFDEPLLDELELEFDELLPATMKEPSLWLVIAAGGRSVCDGAAGYSFACAAVLASAAIPATSVDLSFQCLVMVVTPCFRLDRQLRSGGVTGDCRLYSIQKKPGRCSFTSGPSDGPRPALGLPPRLTSERLLQSPKDRRRGLRSTRPGHSLRRRRALRPRS